MSKAKPLTAEQCEAAREAMLTGHSLSKISRCAGGCCYDRVYA